MKLFPAIACGLIAASIATAPASAAVTLQLDTGGSNSSSTYGNVRTFDFGSVKVQATAFSLSTTGTLTRAYLGQYGEGLGVTNTGEGNGANNTHTIDNQSGFDFVVLTFDRVVNVSAAVLNPFSVGGYTDNDAFVSTAFKLGAFTTSPTTLALNDAVFSALNTNGYNVFGTTANNNTVDLMSGVSAGNIWIIGSARSGVAYKGNGYVDGKIDGFKLDAIKVSPVVPEPATWAMMISGFGLIGASMRRRRSVEVTFTAAA
jgi:hypothetical protein